MNILYDIYGQVSNGLHKNFFQDKEQFFGHHMLEVSLTEKG